MRHEDYPCCGCGPEGCIDFDRVVKCADCGTRFHPDATHEVYCLRCAEIPRRPKQLERRTVEPGRVCQECQDIHDRDVYRATHPDPRRRQTRIEDAWDVSTATVALVDSRGREIGVYCEDCASEVEGEYWESCQEERRAYEMGEYDHMEY